MAFACARDCHSQDERRAKLMAHDETMLRDALFIVKPLDDTRNNGHGDGHGLWEPAGKFAGSGQLSTVSVGV